MRTRKPAHPSAPARPLPPGQRACGDFPRFGLPRFATRWPDAAPAILRVTGEVDQPQPADPRGRRLRVRRSVGEITRLQQLGELLQPSTRQVLQEAGIAEGMTVLDIGCGPGSVTFLAAELVGQAGSVTGVDRDPAMLATARAHALSSAQPGTFIQADLAELGTERWLERGFDAIVDRVGVPGVGGPDLAP
jgi:SAM-dependent methyltransferase